MVIVSSMVRIFLGGGVENRAVPSAGYGFTEVYGSKSSASPLLWFLPGRTSPTGTTLESLVLFF